MPNNNYPRLIKGGIHTDSRGQISFVNDMKFGAIERFSVIGYRL